MPEADLLETLTEVCLNSDKLKRTHIARVAIFHKACFKCVPSLGVCSTQTDVTNNDPAKVMLLGKHSVVWSIILLSDLVDLENVLS